MKVLSATWIGRVLFEQEFYLFLLSWVSSFFKQVLLHFRLKANLYQWKNIFFYKKNSRQSFQKRKCLQKRSGECTSIRAYEKNLNQFGFTGKILSFYLSSLFKNLFVTIFVIIFIENLTKRLMVFSIDNNIL